mmetsp:Transcript_127461/g.354847  ORF Transcript_127461/g.354847 Transcript_127461/m.354847 type:complete len:325 (-) Transcript_127461:58-1032(-)
MQLPPLPQLHDQHKLGQILRGPTESSNWVIPGMLMCGSYPGALEDRRNDQFLKRILSKGVDTFVCLQDELDNDIPEDVWRSGMGLRPYFSDAQKLTRKELKWVQLPIVDGHIAPDEVTAELVVLLAEDMRAGRIIYLHCLGGHGRTGVICCIMLSYLYRITAVEAMKRIQAYHDCRMDPQGAKSPQTVLQRDQVKRQVHQLLKFQAPEVQIKQDLTRVDIDATKRGCMMPAKTASHTASCPAIGGEGSDASDAPTRLRRMRLRTSIHEHAMPDYLALPDITPGARSAKFRRDEIMRQKSIAAALRRKPFAKSLNAAAECQSQVR